MLYFGKTLKFIVKHDQSYQSPRRFWVVYGQIQNYKHESTLPLALVTKS